MFEARALRFRFRALTVCYSRNGCVMDGLCVWLTIPVNRARTRMRRIPPIYKPNITKPPETILYITEGGIRLIMRGNDYKGLKNCSETAAYQNTILNVLLEETLAGYSMGLARSHGCKLYSRPHTTDNR